MFERMYQKMKKMIALLLALIMVFYLVACSGSAAVSYTHQTLPTTKRL